jgi:hypothetical protein
MNALPFAAGIGHLIAVFEHRIGRHGSRRGRGALRRSRVREDISVGVEVQNVLTRRLRAMGIRDKPIAPASPWQNGFAERLIGSIRRECLDHIVVFGEAHLLRILRSYVHYYNDVRTHRSLDKDAPIARRFSAPGASHCFPSWADSITATPGSRFSVRTGQPPRRQPHADARGDRAARPGGPDRTARPPRHARPADHPGGYGRRSTRGSTTSSFRWPTRAARQPKRWNRRGSG